MYKYNMRAVFYSFPILVQRIFNKPAFRREVYKHATVIAFFFISRLDILYKPKYCDY